MSLSKTLNPLLSTGSTQEDPSQHDRKIVDWDVKNEKKQKNKKTLGTQRKLLYHMTSHLGVKICCALVKNTDFFTTLNEIDLVFTSKK